MILRDITPPYSELNIVVNIQQAEILNMSFLIEQVPDKRQSMLEKSKSLAQRLILFLFFYK
ncbi:MAG: hypothetical protein D5R98_07525 [Desulfonatronovibrio sp. MSAO_Bac4]|nr:MAG: hypothetical protein D5R98_07525 [Desulfonatronovibrio sp. MSAO_Bac4]